MPVGLFGAGGIFLRARRRQRCLEKDEHRDTENTEEQGEKHPICLGRLKNKSYERVP